MELIERIAAFTETQDEDCKLAIQMNPNQVLQLLRDCRAELTKQAEYKRKAEIWDSLYEMIEHTSRLSDELPNGTAGSTKAEIVDASLDVWREQQKTIAALTRQLAEQTEKAQRLEAAAEYRQDGGLR